MTKCPKIIIACHQLSAQVFYRCYYYWNAFLIYFRTKARSSNVHSVSDVRTRKGVSLQPLLDSTAKNRDCSCTVLNRTPNQNLVPEPKNEVEERKQVKAWWRRRLRRLPTRVAIKQKLSIVKASIFFRYEPIAKKIIPPLKMLPVLIVSNSKFSCVFRNC